MTRGPLPLPLLRAERSVLGWGTADAKAPRPERSGWFAAGGRREQCEGPCRALQITDHGRLGWLIQVQQEAVSSFSLVTREYFINEI